MARSLNDIIAALPADEQAAIESRYQELKQEVEGLRELRQIAVSRKDLTPLAREIDHTKLRPLMLGKIQGIFQAAPRLGMIARATPGAQQATPTFDEATIIADDQEQERLLLRRLSHLRPSAPHLG